jgi:hypothetical protein
MFVMPLLMASFGSVHATSIEKPVVEAEAVHPGRGPHRHPRRKPHPRPNKKKRTHRLLHGGQYGISSTVHLGSFYGLEAPLYTLAIQSEARTSVRSSTALSLGLAGVGDQTWVELSGQGRFYLAGNFETGFFGGAGLTASIIEEGLIWLRAGPVAGYKQILPGGLTAELGVSTSFLPVEGTLTFLSGGQIGLGGSM